jgi:hypothetical protein
MRIGVSIERPRIPLPPLKRIRADEPPDLRIVPARAQPQQLRILIPVLPRKQMALLPAADGGAGCPVPGGDLTGLGLAGWARTLCP